MSAVESMQLSAYNDGVAAFRNGEPADCDRKRGSIYRQSWYDGWYDAYLSTKFDWWLG